MQHEIAVLNRSTVADDGEIEQITNALQKQVSDDFSGASNGSQAH